MIHDALIPDPKSFIKTKQPEHVTFDEVFKRFREINEQSNPVHKEAVIVYDPIKSNWKEKYRNCPLETRSYVISSDNKFFRDCIGNSMYGDCLDGSERCVKLTDYDWVIDYCYFL